MSSSFSILFYPRLSNQDRNGNVPIYLRITVDGKRSELSIKRKIDINKWNSQSGRLRGSSSHVREINRHLDNIRSRILRIQGDYIEKGKHYTAEILRNDFLGRNKQKHFALGLYQEHNDRLKPLVGHEYSRGAYLRHVRTRKHLANFIKSEYHLEDFPIGEIDLSFINSFEHYLKVLRIGQKNTVTKYIVNLKKIVRMAYARDLISKDPFYSWKAEWVAVERQALSEHELNCIMKMDFRIERLNHVKDIFLFCCFTGLSYSDVKRLSSSHIIIGANQNALIKINRSKTNIESTVPLLSAAKSVLKKYSDFYEANDKKLLLPVISNQKLNAYLKEIAHICKIKKKLTFHLARHTFATTVTLANGVPIESVSRMLGHKALRTTQIYAKVLDSKLVFDLQAIEERYISK